MDIVAIGYSALTSLAAAIIFMTVMFTVGHAKKRYDVVDMAWGLTFIVIALTSLGLRIHSQTINHPVVLLIPTVLVVVWGLRLSIHIFRRLLSTSVEDKRYAELRAKWRGRNQSLNVFLRIYVLQAILASIIMVPVIIYNTTAEDPTRSLIVIGLIVWTIGFYFEAVSDRQLRNFIQNKSNKGKLMTSGLWALSRHPNYFGEVTQWWGIGIIVLSTSYGTLGLIGPAVISLLIIFVSGVPLTEKHFAGRPGWEAYKRRTSTLIPWFPKRAK